MEEIRIENALAEVEVIIRNLTEDLRNRIPKEFIKILQTQKNENHFFEFDKNIAIDEQEMLEETRTILTIIYKDFLCSNEEKQQLNNILIENENILQNEIKEKYSIDKLFNKKIESPAIEKEEQTALVIKKDNFWQKILRKITSIFKNK